MCLAVQGRLQGWAAKLLLVRWKSAYYPDRALPLTFGGMWLLPCVAVARVFALVVRCRNMMLFVYSRVGKNRDTRRESPAGAGAGRTADHLSVFFSQKVLAVREANDIYRPVRARYYYFLVKYTGIIRRVLIFFFFSSPGIQRIGHSDSNRYAS